MTSLRYARPFFIFVFFLVFGYGLFVWYESMYLSGWSEEEKRTYTATAFEETVFQEEAFDRVIGYVRERADRHRESVSIEQDCFVVPKSGNR